MPNTNLLTATEIAAQLQRINMQENSGSGSYPNATGFGTTPNTILNIAKDWNIIERRTDCSGYVLLNHGNLERNRNWVLEFLSTETDGYHRQFIIDRMIEEYNLSAQRLGHAPQSNTNTVSPGVERRLPPDPQAERLPLNRQSYHSTGSNGRQDSSGFQRAMESIQPDYDGIKRTFGIEYEIYSMNEDQENAVAHALRDLKRDLNVSYEVERDGSLSSGGAEIVFYPMSASQYVQTVKRLAKVVADNRIQMVNNDRDDGAGMHTTYGVSNSTCSRSDLQIRINRLALMIKSFLSQSQIKAIFGRDFGYYRNLPIQYSLTTNDHGNAFSTNGRPSNCWECRLPNYKCNPEKMVEFFRATEYVFTRTVTADDATALLKVLGI